MMRSAVLLPLLLILSACGRETQVPDVQITETWGVMSLDGNRIGHTQSVRTERNISREVETFVRSRMAIKRMGVSLDISSDARHLETSDGKPIRFSTLIEMSSTPTLREGVIENGRLRLTTTSGGSTTTQEMEWDPAWLLSEGARLLMIKKGFAAGTKYTIKMFSPDFGTADDLDVEVLGPDTKKVHGKDRELTRLRLKSSLQRGVVTTVWVDEKGTDLSSEMSLMGLKITVEPATKEEALKEAGAELPEIFFQAMPKSNVALPRPRDITTLTVRLERPDGELADWKPPTSTQSVLAREGKSVTLRVEAKPPAPGVPSGADLEMFLKPSAAVQCDDAAIQAEAREIAGQEKDPAVLAGRLASWVYGHIDKKSMNIGAASAREVFTNRSGDCTEHAVLLAAMFRAAGIPAKVCCGYLYFRGAWAGHAWTSAWVGRWVDYDATLGGHVADAARIKFSETDAEDAGALMEGMRGAGYMHGGMMIDIQEYTIDGKTLKASPPAPPAGDTFEAPLLGISFRKPEGWTFRDARDLPPFTLAVLASGEQRAIVSYVDLPYDVIPLDMKKAARKLGAPSSGEVGTLHGRETYETDSRFYVRLSPGEMLELVLKGEEDAARPALDVFKKTLKISR